MYLMTTQKAMRMFESLDANDKKFVYRQMERLHEASQMQSHTSASGLFGLFSLQFASRSKPSKNRYNDEEVDELISSIRHGKA